MMRRMWQRMRVRWGRRRMASTPPSRWPAGSDPGVHRVPGTNTRSAAYRPIRPWQVRNQRFGPAGVATRGLNPVEVAAFLDRVAYDLSVIYAELDRTREQNDRIKDALRRWQSTQATVNQAMANQAAVNQATAYYPAGVSR
ncbi:DivIVA domain-containing protein [Solwaraspora sp. WMMB335]|uniref:DivIVA domain-containing protein n=1 Tax=Solwaraspora sp. WMMB335 TaxID=3404118 RepID=UPI003B949D77